LRELRLVGERVAAGAPGAGRRRASGTAPVPSSARTDPAFDLSVSGLFDGGRNRDSPSTSLRGLDWL